MATDADYFRSDAIFRNQAGREQQNLYDTLAQHLYDRTNKYQGIDTARRDWNTNRNKAGTQTAEGMAARGLLQSGIYKQNLDNTMTGFEKQAKTIDEGEQEVQQQYGARDSMAALPAQNAITDQDYNALAKVYGLLGSKGVQAGNQYTNAINALRAQSAQRSQQNLTNTLGW